MNTIKFIINKSFQILLNMKIKMSHSISEPSENKRLADTNLLSSRQINPVYSLPFVHYSQYLIHQDLLAELN